MQRARRAESSDVDSGTATGATRGRSKRHSARRSSREPVFPAGIMAPLDPNDLMDFSEDFFDVDAEIESLVSSRGREGL